LVRRSLSSRELIYASDGGNAIQVVSEQHWARVGESLRTAAIGSPLTVYDGELTVHGANRRQQRRGRWVLYISADRTLILRPIDAADDDVHGVRLPAAGTSSESWNWAPILCGDSSIIAARAGGEVCRVQVQESNDILHLAIAESRGDLPSLLMAPMAIDGNVVCLGQDGRCLALDPISLKTRGDWQAPAAIRSAIGDGRRVWVCLEDSTVISLRCDAGAIEPEWQRPLQGAGWSIADSGDRLLGIHRDGFMVALDKATGELGRPIRAPGRLVMSPQRVGDELALATEDGGVFFVAAPAVP
jgi:hypothetical protein